MTQQCIYFCWYETSEGQYRLIVLGKEENTLRSKKVKRKEITKVPYKSTSVFSATALIFLVGSPIALTSNQSIDKHVELWKKQ